MSQIRLLAIGACQLIAPLSPLLKARRVKPSHVIGAYTIIEAHQRLRFMRGEFETPKELHRFCEITERLDPSSPMFQPIETADVNLLEPNSPYCTYFGSHALNRATLQRDFLNALAKVGPDAHRATSVWLHQGLLGCNEQRKREAAEFLVPLLDDRIEDVDLVRELLLGMYGRKQDYDEFVSSIAEIRDMVPSPMALVAYIHQYLPDGRPLPWPPEHLEYTIEAARRLNLPIFNPADIVAKFGVDKAMNEARTLYRDEFCPVIGDHLYAFVRDVIDRKAATFIERSTDPVAAAK